MREEEVRHIALDRVPTRSPEPLTAMGPASRQVSAQIRNGSDSIGGEAYRPGLDLRQPRFRISYEVRFEHAGIQVPEFGGQNRLMQGMRRFRLGTSASDATPM